VPISRVVTQAALYGTRGSAVGPRVAERLGVQFLDRAIPSSVAKRAALPEAAVADSDKEPRSRRVRRDVCVELIVVASEFLTRDPVPAGPTGGDRDAQTS